MVEPETWGDPSDKKEESGSLLSSLDILFFSVIAGLLIYWLLLQEASAIPRDKDTPTTGAVPMKGTSFIEKLKKSNRNVIVFYGSQTGTAEEFANRLVKDAQRYGIKGMVADPEEYDMSELPRLAEIPSSLAVFCMATYGVGEPTDNTQDFNDWLQMTDASLEGVNFAVFGLGNKTYDHYNAMGMYTDKRLAELGASRVFELGLGDDDGNLEADFITWKDQLWPAVCEFFGLQATQEECSVRQFKLVVHNDGNMNQVYTGEVGCLMSFKLQLPPFDAKNPFLAPVTINRKLTKGESRHVMHIELDISRANISYDVGDHVAIHPMNDTSLVNRLEKRLDVDLDTIITLKNLDEEANKKHPFPCPTTYRTALIHYLDITSPLHTNVLFELSQYSSDPEEKEFLCKMASSSSEGKALYHSWVVESERNILAVLDDLPSLQPPLDHLCELLPRLQARYYSIASSAKVHPTSVHICAVVVEYTTKTGRVFKGVATNFLRNKVVTNSNPRPVVPMHIRKSQFRLPSRASNPIVMIGPGTGIAPFMGFIQERAWQKEKGMELGETILFFGCRHRNEDFIYQEELEAFEKAGVLTQLNVAFSRDQEHKVYVQHLLKQNKEHLWKLIYSNGAHIYVCGEARNMAKDVHVAFHEIAEEVGGLTHSQAVDYFQGLMTKGCYSQDVWS